MGFWASLVGLAAFATVCATMLFRSDRRDYDDTWAAVALVGVWAFSGAWWEIQKGWFPDNHELAYWAGPMVDLPFGLWVASRHFRVPAKWKMAIILLCAGQLTAHAAFGLGDRSPIATYWYKASLNGSTFAQLCCVASSGVGHGLRRAVRSKSGLGLRRIFRSLPSRAMVRGQRSGGQGS